MTLIFYTAVFTLIKGFAWWTFIVNIFPNPFFKNLDKVAIALARILGLAFIGIYFYSFFEPSEIPLGPFWKTRIAPFFFCGVMLQGYWFSQKSPFSWYRGLHSGLILLFSYLTAVLQMASVKQYEILESGLSSWDGASMVLIDSGIAIATFFTLTYAISTFTKRIPSLRGQMQ